VQSVIRAARGREQLANDYVRARRATIELIAPLDPEDCVIQTLPEVSPTKWHIAHVTWFFETFCLKPWLQGYEPFDERFGQIFNSYYYGVGPMHPRERRGVLSRPSFRLVLAWRRHVDEAMEKLIETVGDEPEVAKRVTLGIHHEEQHQELLLADIKHVFFSNPLAPAYLALQAARETAHPGFAFVSLQGGRVRIGAGPDAPFCFDNETPRHELLLQDFELGNRLVTNSEYRRFIQDGGYRDPRLWLADGWSLVESGALERPLYWSEDLAREFTLGGWRDIEEDAPVAHVSYFEADAYARWADARLPLEAEWETAAAGTPVHGNLLDGGTFRPLPAQPVGSGNGRGLRQLWGDVWEWTSSPYVAYPGFRPLPGALGEYNGKFMSGQMVVRGGSCATWQSHLRASYRSFFYPRDRWQFLGFRLARDR